MNNKTYLDDLVFALVGSQELVQLWWNSPNLAFEGQCPKDVEQTKVVAYLEFHCYG